jgi:hypothetical protein
MTAPNTAPSPGIADVPVNPAALNVGEGDGFDALTTPASEAPAPAGSIAAASRALRDAKDEAPAPEPETQPRNPDGTFAPKEPVEGEAPETPADAPESPESDAAPEAEAAPAEPKVFTLKGEEQRGESDIELDVTDLPPEVIERLERNEKQGMRRATFDAEMRKVRADRANLDAVETEISVDPEGFVLTRVPPARRLAIGQALLLEQFDELAPMIEVLWNDPRARFEKLDAIRSEVANRRGEVASNVQASRQAAEIRAAVSELIPDTASEADSEEFFATSIALLQQRAMQNQSLTSTDVPKLLDAHRRRFFGASVAPAAPPSRPRLAVKTTPSKPAAPAASAPTTVLSAEEVARRAKARQAALATAPRGAGVGAVQRDVGPANETIEQRSRRLRAS